MSMRLGGLLRVRKLLIRECSDSWPTRESISGGGRLELANSGGHWNHRISGMCYVGNETKGGDSLTRKPPWK
jgi:hypothetical protein